ncbi:calpain family cysteine protease (macronuclear) [Tetrahymena thermophila SB210]|uniref:Calpain family cysteine protease n=1 Tax=Tetrahymena thermophila (strain SB210) TaxID=312017 RepID=Q23JH5_TETTS|nr:calpain family cysteine protease [Tetrahymena thermophila SB210]EAR96669.2 calpain family cysteine protease [Tetrahymena thermophila SB210]|eukprot:XP_001016914.2 calpain family cysteine protease [Tetrahymena thermophila SB210]
MGCFFLVNALLILFYIAMVSCFNVDFVYSPLPLFKYDIIDQQGATTKIKVAEKANLVFVSAGGQGVIVLDGLSNEIIFQMKAKEFLFSIEATSDGEYVMFSYESQFSVFQFQNRRSLILLSQANFPTSIIDMSINNKEDTVFAVGLGGYLIAYDISQKKQVQIVGQFNSQSNIIHQIYISKDDQWILLGNDVLGMAALQLSINQNDHSIDFTLAGQGIMNWKTWAVVVTDDLQYVYGLDNWFGIYICDFRQVTLASQALYPVNVNFIKYWPFHSINLIYTLKLTKDNKYLLIGFRSEGVYLFNIEDRLNPSIFQQIPVPGQSLSVNLSPNEQYLYYANALSIYVFERHSANLNNNYPNLFNVQQATLLNTTTAMYKWRCITREINGLDYYFGSFDLNGFYIFNADDPYNLIQIYSQQFGPLTLVDSMVITQDKKYLYVPIEDNNTSFIVYDIQNITQPFEVFRLNINNQNHEESIMFSQDQNYLVSSNDIGILLFDSSKPPTLALLASWNILPFMTGENAGVMITNDNRYIIGTVRNYGLYVLDATVKTNLIFKSTLQTLGAEGIICSNYSNNYAFLLDGFKGVAILDLTVLPQIKILSRIPLTGWVNHLLSLQQDTFLLTVVMENQMLTLIDISDKEDPQILSAYQYQDQSAQSLCLSSNNKYSFLNNQFGTVVLPLNSQVLIHTEIEQITLQIDGSQLLNPVSKDQHLKVGQFIQLKFVFIYPVNGVQIVSVSYYFDFQNNPLPFWMNYNQNSGILQITVDKSGLSSKNINIPNLNTILLKVITPLSPESFQFNSTDVQTTPSEAQMIFSTLQNINLIDSVGYVTELFDPQKSLFFEINTINCTTRLYQMTQLVLQQSININPVIFYIEPSLSIDITNLNNPIQTLSQSIQLYLMVNTQDGKFVIGDFNGVIASTNDSQNQIKLEGSLVNLNSVLSKKIIFANFTDLKAINVTITLIDGVNYDVVQDYLIQQCVFIKQKQLITKNPLNSLQQQFNKQYPQAQIDILTFFSINFAKNSFIVNDVQSISYQAFLLEGQQFRQLNTEDWIQFQDISEQISISGIPPASAYRQTFYIKIVASDGYTQDSDIFQINAYGLPFILIFDLLIKILGPVFAIFGLYKYKSYVINLLFQNYVTYSDEIAIIGKFYFKKITLCGDQLEKSQLLFKEFVKQFEYNQDQFNEIEKFYNHELEKETQQPDKEQNMLSFIDGQTKKNLNTPRRLKVITEFGSKNDEFLKKSICIIQMSSKHIRKTFLEKQYIKKDGDINILKIIRDIKHKNISFNLKGKKYCAQNMVSDFKNPDSLIFKGIKAIAARYFLKLDTASYQVYSYIKYYALKYHNYTKNDWYKSVIQITPTEDKDCYGLPIPFSSFKLNEQQLNLILIDLQLHNEIGQSFESIKNQGINHLLIKEVLSADAKGLIEQTPSIFFPSEGESVHLFQYEIQSIQAFKKVENTWCTGIRKALNFEYTSYGVSKSQNLPSWLQVEYKKGGLVLQGTPQSQDEENILIRIIDQDLQVIQQFMLQVVYEYQEQNQSNNNPNKLCDSIATEDFFQQSRIQSNRIKSDISYLTTPIQRNQLLDSTTQTFNKYNQTDEQPSNTKRLGKYISNRTDQYSDKYENKIKDGIFDQSTVFNQMQFDPKNQTRFDTLNQQSNQNSINNSFNQNQILINYQNNQQDELQQTYIISTQDQNQNIFGAILKRNNQSNQDQKSTLNQEEEKIIEENNLNQISLEIDQQKSQFSQNIQNQQNYDQNLQEDSIQEEQKVKSLQDINEQFKQKYLEIFKSFQKIK